LRAREESEAVASYMQKEMEAKVATLQDENKALNEELQKLSSKLKQRTNEARAYKSQTDSWKSRLAKIKMFLNELGADYQNLRGEAINFKATRKSLDKERKEISETIEDVKAQLAQISQTSRDRRGCLLESESLITSLRQELKHADERARYSQGQLADEKKRSHLLELYIQNCSRTHDKKLDLVRSGQLEMTRKMGAALRAKADDCELSQIISEDFGQKLEELMALVRSTAENVSNNKMDMQQYERISATFESR
jgi:chromosome segregation ATPase